LAYYYWLIFDVTLPVVAGLLSLSVSVVDMMLASFIF
jgi:hypothetical protein